MNISKMTVTRLKQELTQRGLPTDGVKPVLIKRLREAMAWKNSNEAFHSLSAKAATTAQARAEKQVQLKDAPLEQEKPSLHRQRWSKEFEWVIQDLSEAYDVEWKYGDPTARKRILIVGLRRDIFEPKGIKWQWPREVCDQTFYLSLYVGTSPSKTKTSPSRTGSTETTQSGLGHTRRGR